MSDEAAALAAIARTGRLAASYERVAGSIANTDLVVTLDDGSLVLAKVGPADELIAEGWACRRLVSDGLPVPPVVTLEPEIPGDPARGVLVLGFVPGAPSDEPVVARAAGAMFRAVHAIELTGWGSLVPQPDGSARGQYDTWAESLAADLAGVDHIVEAGIVGADLARRGCELVLGDGGPTAYDRPGGLLHRDLKVQHLFGLDVGRGVRLSSVIDWGFVGVGDPEVDLARLSMAGPQVLGAFLGGYGVELDDALSLRLARYRIWWDLSTLIYEHDAGGDFFDPYRNRVAADVALLDGR